MRHLFLYDDLLIYQSGDTMTPDAQPQREQQNQRYIDDIPTCEDHWKSGGKCTPNCEGCSQSPHTLAPEQYHANGDDNDKEIWKRYLAPYMREGCSCPESCDVAERKARKATLAENKRVLDDLNGQLMKVKSDRADRCIQSRRAGYACGVSRSIDIVFVQKIIESLRSTAGDKQE